MAISRQSFSISTDTGHVTDTGPPFNGRLVQAAWDPSTADTGADLRLDLVIDPAKGDTGGVIPIVNDNDCLGAMFNRVYMQPSHNASGNPVDTGDDFPQPVYSASERIRVTVTPGGAAVAGTLRLYTRDD